MPVNASALGTRFAERTVAVTPRMMLAYAAGIGQTGAWTFDDDDDGFVAAPQFCISLEWPTVSHPDVRELLGLTPGEMLRALHVGQDSFFHRPIVAGDRLRIHGTLTDIRESRAGAITVSRIESADADTGEPVVTSWSTVLIRGVTVAGTTAAATDKPAPATGVAASRQALEIPIDRGLPHVYTECAAVWNPIHTERKVALAVGLPDIILQGTATWALAGRELIRIHAQGDPRRLRRLGGRFGAVVIPGTRIRLEHGASDADPNTICFSVRNAAGDEAISAGIAEFAGA